MFERLMNLDCELIVLGTKLFTVKEKVAAEIRYGAHVASDKTYDVTDKVKKSYNETMKNIKSKNEERKTKIKAELAKKKEEKVKPVESVKKETVKDVKPEAKKEELAQTTEVVIKDENKVERVEAEVVEESTLVKGVTYAPNFEPYENVTIPVYDEDRIPKSVTPKEEKLKEVKPEHITEAIRKAAQAQGKTKK